MQNLPKFGAATRESSSNITYASFEEVTMEHPAQAEEDKDPTKNLVGKIAAAINKRRAQGDWTLLNVNDPASADRIGARAGSAPGAYVPPARRGGAMGTGTELDMDQDTSTLRVTNITEDASEDDLRELFRPFGRVLRIYLAKDRVTMQSRGFAFVTYEMREDAERAKQVLDGRGYDHLILKVDWARPAARDPGSEGLSSRFVTGYGKALPQGK